MSIHVPYDIRSTVDRKFTKWYYYGLPMLPAFVEIAQAPGQSSYHFHVGKQYTDSFYRTGKPRTIIVTRPNGEYITTVAFVDNTFRICQHPEVMAALGTYLQLQRAPDRDYYNGKYLIESWELERRCNA